MPSFKQATHPSRNPRFRYEKSQVFSLDEIIEAREDANAVVSQLVDRVCAGLLRHVGRRDRSARRAVKNLNKAFRIAASGHHLPSSTVVADLLDEVFDLVVDRLDPITVSSSLEIQAVCHIDAFLRSSPGGYTPEMLAVVLADLFRIHGALSVTDGAAWFVGLIRPEQLWRKPERGTPRKMIATEQLSGMVWSPAAVHWVRRCRSTV